MFCEENYIYKHRSHRIDCEKAGNDLYGELKPYRRRQPPVECQNADLDKEYRDEVLDFERVPNLQRTGIGQLLFFLTRARKLISLRGRIFDAALVGG